MIKNPIGYGTFPNKDELVNLLPLVDELGYALVDTSDDYYNEKYVSEGSKSTHLKIFSKFSLVQNCLKFNESFAKQNKTFQNNGLKINCYLIHWPYPFLYKKIWKKMEDLYLNGEVDEIGVCNFNVKALRELLQGCRVKPMYNEIELHPLFQQKEVTEFCKENDIKIISYSPFARMDKELMENGEIKKIAESHDTTVINVILKWNLQKGFIPIPSTKNIIHLNEMSPKALAKIQLSDTEICLIDSLDKGKRVRFDPDTYFGIKTKIKLFLYSVLMR